MLGSCLISYCCDYLQDIDECHLISIGCCSINVVFVLKYKEVVRKKFPSSQASINNTSYTNNFRIKKEGEDKGLTNTI